jgi:membrane protein
MERIEETSKACLGIGRSSHRKPAVRIAPQGTAGRHPGNFILLLKLTFTRWNEDNVPKLAAALAYYTAFSVAPILLITIALAGMVFGLDVAQGAISREISGLIGPRIGEGIDVLLKNAWHPKFGALATILGAIALLYGASGVLRELQDSLNLIWKVKKATLGIWGTLRARSISFAMVLGIGFLLLVSLVLSAGSAALGKSLAGWGNQGLLVRILNHTIPLLVITALFGAAFKILPDAKTRWRDVGVGAFLTAALFTLGKYLMGIYLAKSAVGSLYGAAGSFVLLLLWINYSSQIFFCGAEFTKAWADLHGASGGPTAEAITVPDPRPGSFGLKG